MVSTDFPVQLPVFAPLADDFAVPWFQQNFANVALIDAKGSRTFTWSLGGYADTIRTGTNPGVTLMEPVRNLRSALDKHDRWRALRALPSMSHEQRAELEGLEAYTHRIYREGSLVIRERRVGAALYVTGALMANPWSKVLAGIRAVTPPGRSVAQSLAGKQAISRVADLLMPSPSSPEVQSLLASVARSWRANHRNQALLDLTERAVDPIADRESVVPVEIRSVAARALRDLVGSDWPDDERLLERATTWWQANRSRPEFLLPPVPAGARSYAYSTDFPPVLRPGWKESFR